MKKGLIQNLLFIFIISTSLTFISCSNTTKKITVSENTEGEVSLEESEIIKAITTGEKLLDENKIKEAKEYFNKAISLEKENKDTYIRIKDKYVSINKLDEAYNIIKTAISNNVDIENMKLILKEISSKFEVIKISNSIYQNSSYSLPKEVNINISDTPISIPVTWNNENLDTNILGTFSYEGYNDEYGRKIIVELTVIENVYDKEIGYIKDIYISNGKTYVDIDLAELYQGSDAKAEAIKDNKAAIDENGNYIYIAAFYIRNNYDKISTYELSNDCIFQLTPYDLDPYSSEPLNMITVDYNTFFRQVEKVKSTPNNMGLFCWIKLKNNCVYSIYSQYTS